jgi:hypothetical protein
MTMNQQVILDSTVEEQSRVRTLQDGYAEDNFRIMSVYSYYNN